MKNLNNLRRKVFTLANTLYWTKGLNRSESFKKAWKVIRIKESMKADQVKFTYQKKDGTIRHATGTTSSQFFTYTRKTNRPTPITVVTYFDIDKQAFRAFKAENITLEAA